MELGGIGSQPPLVMTGLRHGLSEDNWNRAVMRITTAEENTGVWPSGMLPASGTKREGLPPDGWVLLLLVGDNSPALQLT